MIDIKEMLKAGIHFGHKTSRWAPSMSSYVWGSRNKIHLIDVSKTAFLLERTGKYLKKLAQEGGTFLWVGTKKPAQKIIKETALKLRMPYVVHRWIGGSLSNHDQIKKAITKLLHLKEVVGKSKTIYKKKEISMIQKEIARLEKNIGGIVDLAYPPAAVIVVDAKKEASAIREALNLKIPTAAIVDTNTNPAGINFVIPANDDSPRSIAFVIEYLASNIAEGKKEYEAKKAELRAERTSKTSEKKSLPPRRVAPQVKKHTAKAPDTKAVKAETKEPAKTVSKPAAATKKETIKVADKNKEAVKKDAKPTTKTTDKTTVKKTTSTVKDKK